MFTGIIQDIGTILATNFYSNNKLIKIKTNLNLRNCNIGDSIAVNGTCLTVCKKYNNIFEANVMKETINRTNLKYLKSNSKVNIEKALKIGDQVGGHFVTGHIDKIGKIIEIKNTNNIKSFLIQPLNKEKNIFFSRSSIAIDGISLTVRIDKNNIDNFWIDIIPTTKEETILNYKKEGDYVNIEFDILLKGQAYFGGTNA